MHQVWDALFVARNAFAAQRILEGWGCTNRAAQPHHQCQLILTSRSIQECPYIDVPGVRLPGVGMESLHLPRGRATMGDVQPNRRGVFLEN